MSKLLEYFNVVDKCAVARAAHQSSPVASMNAFGLNAEEQQAVLSGSRENLAKSIGLVAVDIPIVHVPNSVHSPSQQSFGGDLKTLHVPLTIFH